MGGSGGTARRWQGMIRAELRGAGWLRVTGHADFAPYGEDLVCAGVSALVYTLAANVPEEAVIRLESGDCEIRWEGKEPQILQAFAVIWRGLVEMRQVYGSFLETVEYEL